MTRDKYRFISLNLLKKSHKNLIEWILWAADDKEISISSFCINILKKEYDLYKERGEWTDTEKRE